MVLVDVQVALGGELEVEQGVAGEGGEHVVEEADAGGDAGAARAVERQAAGDARLAGAARDLGRSGGGGVHGAPPLLLPGRGRLGRGA